jgi:hypothetical protein
MDTSIKPQPTIHLQAIGRVAAKPAGELLLGDVIMWNFGYTSKVVDITTRGTTQIVVHTQRDNDSTYTRVMNKTRLVAVKGL